MEAFYSARDFVLRTFYKGIVRPICFLFDAEKVHNFFINFGKFVGKFGLTRFFLRRFYGYSNKALEQEIFGVKFPNPVGLSAGFDKNACIIPATSDLGFGFSEVGSITAKKCLGNSGKRLERIKEKRSLWVYLGLNNLGSDEIYESLENKNFDIPVFISVAKTNCKETAKDEIGIKDYVYSLKRFEGVGDFFVLNISCPNAYGGEPFSEAIRYEKLLKEVSKLKIKRPILVKMAPDLTKENIDSIIRISRKYGVRGFICSNLSKKENSFGRGGLSGKVVEEDSNKLLSYIYKKTRGEFLLVGVGGIFSAEDAYKKIKLGANLVEIITGMIYEGPNLISEVNRGLVKLLKKDGYKNVGEAVGKGV